MFDTKLDSILIKLATDIMDLRRTNERLGAPLERAKESIYQLLDEDGNNTHKSLGSDS